ncbi:MAG TPA: FHA domain-containing protein [Candidatus Cryosericum sp.]|nr:FHA domain-containing protein [Candidatus Cryosericum sp.]
MRFRTMKKFLMLTVALAFVLAGMPSALAQDEAQLQIAGGNASGDVYQIVFYSSAPDAPTAETLSVQIDGQPVDLKSVNPISYADPGTTYVILFDTNTAVTERALPDMKSIAERILAGMGTQDNALIAPLGGKIAASDITDDADKLNASIEALAKDESGTDLYSTMSDALKLLNGTDASLRPRKCLIVMADGLDSSSSGISALELSNQISTSNVPIYTIALTYNTKTTERVEAAKTISGFARQSPGGLSQMLKTDGLTVENAADAILAQHDFNYLAVLDNAAVRAVSQGDSAEITLTFSAASGALTDTLTLSLASLPKAEATAQPTAEPTAAVEGSPQPVIDNGGEKGFFDVVKEKLLALPAWVLWTAGAAVVVVIALIVLLASLSKKKKSKAPAPGTVVRFGTVSEETPGMAGAPDICVVRLGEKEKICCEISMPLSFAIGKDPKNAQLILADDPAIAPVQCRLLWKDGAVWVEEKSKKNKTLLNGSPVVRPVCLNSGDVLTLGSFEYRVFWEQR